MGIEIELFGGVRATRDGRAIGVQGDLPRAVIARLAMSVGEVVGTDRLIDDIWTTPPTSALSSLRATLSRLRAAGFAESLIGSRAGYVLAVERADVDLVRFRDGMIAFAGRPAASTDSVSVLGALESVSASRLFGDLEGSPFLEPVRSSVRAERRHLVEELAELHLDDGDAGLAVGLLSSLLDDAPSSERAVRLLALALARSGRTSDALRVLDDFRRRSVEEGRSVSTRIDEIRQGVLRQDPAVFDRARAVTPSRTGVPIPITRFVGRDLERALLHEVRGSERLITIVGPGGVGKTRLAVEHARESTTAVDDEQWMVDLSVVDGADDVVVALADAVGATEHDVAAVQRRVGDLRGLLIIDNADLVLGAVAVVVGRLLDGCPGLTVLVTSREALRVSGERIVAVGPMSEADARDLFLQRARDARAGIELVTDGAGTLDGLLTHLEGLPLSIELTAARLDLASVGELAESVSSAGAHRDLAEMRPPSAGRHRSVVQAVSWSVDWLDSHHRSLLGQLARFAGGFTPDAAIAICRVEGGEDLGEALAALVRKSLVSMTLSSSGSPEYRLLESVRSAVLDAAAPAHEWHFRHGRWMAARALELARQSRSFDARSAGAELELLAPDLRMALAAAIDRGDRRVALDVAAGQAPHWFAQGRLVDGRIALERALAVAGETDDAAEARAFFGLCNLAYQSGDAPAAFNAIAAAGAAARRAGDDGILLAALSQEAYGRSLFGDLDTARSLVAEAEAVFESAPDWARSEFHMCRGQMLRAAGHWDDALAAVTEAHRIAGSIGYTWMIASAVYVTGKVLVDARRPREAIGVLSSGIRRLLINEHHTSVLALMHVAAGASAFVERHEEGAQLFGAIDKLGERFDWNPVVNEGADAQERRDAVAVGISADEFDRAYRAGQRLEFDGAVRIVEGLPGSLAALRVT